MAVLWMDGFELGSAGAIWNRYEYQGDGINAVIAGRTNQGLDCGNGSFGKAIGTQNGIIHVAYAMYFSFFSGHDILKIFSPGYPSDSTPHISIHCTASGTFEIWRGSTTTGTLLGTVPALITAGFWVHFEWKILIHASAGSVELKLNEISEFSLTGVNTKGGTTNGSGVVWFGARPDGGGFLQMYRLDDYLIANTDNPYPVGGWYGNTKIEALLPSGNGDVIGWTGFNDSNYKNVDESAHNSDTDYNYASTTNTSDLYQMGNMSDPSGSVRAVQLTYVARKDDALPRVTAPLLKTGGTVYAGGNDSLTTSYVHYYETWQFNPNTSDYFTVSEVNALQAGIQVRG